MKKEDKGVVYNISKTKPFLNYNEKRTNIMVPEMEIKDKYKKPQFKTMFLDILKTYFSDYYSNQMVLTGETGYGFLNSFKQAFEKQGMELEIEFSLSNSRGIDISSGDIDDNAAKLKRKRNQVKGVNIKAKISPCSEFTRHYIKGKNWGTKAEIIISRANDNIKERDSLSIVTDALLHSLSIDQSYNKWKKNRESTLFCYGSYFDMGVYNPTKARVKTACVEYRKLMNFFKENQDKIKKAAYLVDCGLDLQKRLDEMERKEGFSKQIQDHTCFFNNLMKEANFKIMELYQNKPETKILNYTFK